MKPKDYDKIPAASELGPINVPGCYCINCGELFALYSFSIHQPMNKDENGKLYYENCFLCMDRMKVKEIILNAKARE